MIRPHPGPASRRWLRRRSGIRADPLARRRRVRRRTVWPVSRVAALSGRIRPAGLLGSAAPDEYARRLFADAGHPGDVAHGLPALLHRAQRDAALAELAGTALVGLHPQRRHPLGEPVVHRIGPLARRKEHRQVIHVGPRPRRHRLLRRDRRLPRSLSRCLRCCTTRHSHALSPPKPLMPHPNPTTFPTSTALAPVSPPTAA